jgi:tripartite ATP-independent transporter DctM subunit
MTEPQIAIMMLGLLVLAIFLGFPIAFTLMALAIAFGYYAYFEPGRMDSLFDNRVFDLFVNQTYSTMSNDVLTAVPLFLFMGYVLERVQIVDKLFDAVYAVTWRLPGAMAVAALFTCTLFAIASGIVGAVVVLMGLLALPQMLKARYDVSFATGVICAGGTLGILIPPSVMLVVYGAASGVSVVRLYAGAFLPGFLLAGLYFLYVIGRAWLQPSIAPRPKKEDFPERSWLQLGWLLLTSVVPLASLTLFVLVAIFFGWATPTESAALGASGALVLAILYRKLTWDRIRESVYLTVRATAMVCWLFIGSSTFASVFAYLGGQNLVNDFVSGLPLNHVTFLIVSQAIIFLLGWPLEWTEIVTIFIPIFLPLLPIFDVDPLMFGILVAVNLQSAYLSPPMAMSAYYLKGVSPDYVQINQIFRGMIPYMFIVLVCLVLIYLFPGVVYWLPDSLYN